MKPELIAFTWLSAELSHSDAAAGGALSPANTPLLTQQGGTILLRDEKTVFRQDDAGILKYTSIADLTKAIAEVKQKSFTAQSQV